MCTARSTEVPAKVGRLAPGVTAALAAGLALSGFVCADAALAQTRRFQHIIIAVQENRTPDNVFGSNPQFEPGVDIATSGKNSQGQTVLLTPLPLSDCYDISHSHKAFEQMYDNGKMDGADLVALVVGTGCVPPQNPQFKYVDNSTGGVQPYFDIAKQYGFANRMFQTNQGPSFAAHQFLFGGTSAPTESSVLFVSNNSSTPNNNGCIATPTTRVKLIDPAGSETTNAPIYPCFERPTLSDELDLAGVSWAYYTPSASFVWSAPDAINHICMPVTASTGKKSCTGIEWTTHMVLNPAQLLTDVQQCKLPAVVWSMPDGANSDHPKLNTGGGPAWIASIVNAIGTQPSCAGGESYWQDTAIVVTWDDWGGFYDHVPPPRIGQPSGWGTGYTYGFRVPLLVVSAYTPAGYVDNDEHDFGSILRMVETNFNVGLIGPGYYADAYADNLGKFFSLATPRTFKAIAVTAVARAAVARQPSGIALDDDEDDD